MFRFHMFFTMVVGLCLMFPAHVGAEEGGTGHYAPGNIATLVDSAPTKPGWVIQPLVVHYGGNFDGTKTLPVGGVVSTGLDVTVDSFSVGGLYSAEKKVFGATYSAGLFLPIMWMEVTGTVDGFSRTDTASGLGDMVFVPLMLAWKPGKWQYNAILPVYAPTGNYEAGQLANLGLNYWTFDPTFGMSYSNPETLFNFAVHGGLTLNTKNTDTDYQSGSVLHVEVSAQQLTPWKSGLFGYGVNGFVYEQVTGDSGSGATHGGFKGRSLGVGPVFDYVLPSKSGTWVFEFRWLPELETKNRVEGDFFWLKAAWQF